MDRVSFSLQDNYTHVTQEHVASAVADFQTIAPVNSIESTKISQSMLSPIGEFGLTTTGGRLLAEKNSFTDELIYSAIRSTFQDPINGVAQLIDASAGTKSLDALRLVPAPEEHEFLSANWTAQQVGSILGMSVPFLLLHKGVGTCSAKLLGPAATCSLAQSRRATSEAMVTAGLYDGLLRETPQSRLATEELADNRVKQALVGAATMGTLTRCSSTLRSLSPLGSKTSPNELLSSTISGVPAGAVHAELESRLYRGTSARPEDLAQSMITFTILGGTFAAGKNLLSSKSQADPTYHYDTNGMRTRIECAVATQIPGTSSVTRPKPGIASCKLRQSETQAPEFADSSSAENNSLQSVLRIPDLRMEGMRKNHEVPREEVLDKVVELEVMFGIEIAPPDQSMRNPWKFWQGRPLAIPDKLVTRVPEWSEVIGLEAGLYRSAPSIERGLTYHFFAVPKVQGMAQEHFSGGLYERRQIFFQPNTSSLKALHEPAMRGSSGLACNMQALSTHENAHHGQFRCGLNDSKFLEPIARRLGWEKSVFNGMQTWLMKTADGQSYRFDRLGRQWIHVPDEIGNPADPTRLSSAEFQRRLKVRPVTDYFDEPIEMITEGTTFFRLGGEHRAYLFRKSPELYDVVKDLDQFEINKLLKPKNQPLTRDLEGRVVPETVELKAQIQALESEWQSRSKRGAASLLCDK